ncbi:TPA: DUF1642 domain-containing protein [Enterococcus faecium]|nr:DUF1642 domain-containing protein [Enterococcus faecium]HAZ1081421.1 DUF1642 domain-containing protein [Enterococcus faecium]
MASCKNIRYIVKELDELQKPVVPKFVADWIEYAKKKGDSLAISFKPWNLYGVEYSKADRWIEDNQETFARAWLDGYEVEKEPLWAIKNANGNYLTKCALWGTDGVNHSFECNPSYQLLFTDKATADAAALLVNGTVEEVAEG